MNTIDFLNYRIDEQEKKLELLSKTNHKFNNLFIATEQSIRQLTNNFDDLIKTSALHNEKIKQIEAETEESDDDLSARIDTLEDDYRLREKVKLIMQTWPSYIFKSLIALCAITAAFHEEIIKLFKNMVGQ